MKKRINITIDEKTLYIVDKLAEARGIDRSTMITLCIREKDSLGKYPYALDYYNDLSLDTPLLKDLFEE